MSDAQDHEFIWLQPACCENPYEGRLWCEDPDPVPCEDGVPWTKYIRADIYAKAVEALREIRDLDCHHPTEHGGCMCVGNAEELAARTLKELEADDE